MRIHASRGRRRTLTLSVLLASLLSLSSAQPGDGEECSGCQGSSTTSSQIDSGRAQCADYSKEFLAIEIVTEDGNCHAETPLDACGQPAGPPICVPQQRVEVGGQSPYPGNIGAGCRAVVTLTWGAGVIGTPRLCLRDHGQAPWNCMELFDNGDEDQGIGSYDVVTQTLPCGAGVREIRVDVETIHCALGIGVSGNIICHPCTQ